MMFHFIQLSDSSVYRDIVFFYIIIIIFPRSVVFTYVSYISKYMLEICLYGK